MMTMSMNTRMMPACAAPAVTAAVSSSCSREDPASVGHTTLSSGNSEQTRPIMAERYKTKMCRNYVETGACPYETRCMFAHGAHELRTPEMNIRDGLITEEAIRLYRRQLHHATLYGGGCEYPAPPYVYDAAYGWSYGHGGPVPMAFAYAHNPYASDVLPQECRLYSRAPTCSTTGLLPLPLPPPPQYEEEEQQQRRQPCDDVVVNARTVVTAMPRARSVQRDDDDAEFSTCSSVGSDSGEHQQFAADSVCTKQQQQLSQEDDEGTEADLW